MQQPDSQRPAEMAKAYEPQQVEQRLYDWWEAQGFFAPAGDPSRPPFTISMPPPNVTGELHMGHAMTATIEDVLIRWHRMLGDSTLWLPGADHAGIATQTQVEKLLRSEGTSRQEIGREEFLRRTWDWKARYGGEITRQLRRLGASCDWSRERFTLDAGLSRAVRTAFKRLYDDGLIYRGTYLVNWSPNLQTAVSDLEVEREERQANLWYVRYPLLKDGGAPEDGPGSAAWGGGSWAAGADEYITIATTRPETILGDTAVAVHPDDERYRALVGRTAIVPAVGRAIPIIADSYVDPEFGTGAVKITPAHDPNDYQLGARHRLPMINIMNKDATLNGEAGPYAGQERFAARASLVADLEREGLLVKVEPHMMSVGISQRGREVIEPLLSEQWFVRTRPLADLALAAVKEGRTRIVPERFEKVYFHWLENIEDWCISRQLWWGHRIPVWYDADGRMIVPGPDDPDPQGQGVTQDPDVLDTWFSSGLWPFSTLGWPDATPDMRAFYPTSLMETGYDILFFWVARMMMMGCYLTGIEPFHTVYLHGLVRDKQGRKMSKSYGNVINPLEIIDQYGVDALRFSLATSSTPGQDLNLNPERIEAARNFANKLWNITRFVLSKLGDERPAPSAAPSAEQYTLADRWILSRYNQLAGDVDRLLRGYNLGEAGRQIQDFLWSAFADWYVEIAKVQMEGDEPRRRLTRSVLYSVLEGSLRLLHPFMPFVTEETWQYLTGGQEAAVSSQQSAGGSQQSAVSSQQSAVSSQQSAVSSQQSAVSSQQSAASSQQSADGSQRPAVSSQQPAAGSQGGEGGGQEPGARGQDPAGEERDAASLTPEPRTLNPSIMVAAYPAADEAALDEAAERDIGLLQALIAGIRNVRNEYKVEPARYVAAGIAAGERAAMLEAQRALIVRLARVADDQLTIGADPAERAQGAATLVVGDVEVALPLAGLIDLDAERARLGKELDAAEADLARREARLANAGFVEKAPAAVVQRERDGLAAARATVERLRERIDQLG